MTSVNITTSTGTIHINNNTDQTINPNTSVFETILSRRMLNVEKATSSFW